MILRINILILFSCILFSCSSEPIELPTDEQLRRSLVAACDGCSNEFSYYQLNELTIPKDPNNLFDPKNDPKIKLGKLLFHETALGLAPMRAIGKGTYSCASCHFASAGFQAGRWQGIGDGGLGFGVNGKERTIQPSYFTHEADLQPIKSPSVLNVAYQDITLWNGSLGATGQNIGTESEWIEDTPLYNNYLGFYGVETQAIAGLKVHRMDIDSFVIYELSYKSKFNNAFPNTPEDERYTIKNAGLAIAAYERTIIAEDAPFQKWLSGKPDAMTESQKKGATLFFGKAQCASCHNGPALNGYTSASPTSKFYAIGLKDLSDLSIAITPSGNISQNLGRGGFTQQGQDFYKFKVPQLYNLKDSPFYGHGSSFTSIKALLEYKNKGQKENAQTNNIADEFVPLGLTEKEIDDLTDFITNALYDPNLLDNYQPEEVQSLNCIPNNDEDSKNHLGCE